MQGRSEARTLLWEGAEVLCERRAFERDPAVGGRLQAVPEAGDMAGRRARVSGVGGSRVRRREAGPVQSEERVA